MQYQILTDSGCDLPQQKLKELGVACLPLTVSFRGKVMPDSVDDGIAALYAGLRAGEIATTSAVNPTAWEKAMESVLAQGMDLLVIAFSSGLSTTYQSAEIAASELRSKYPQHRICVVDGRSASLGQGLFVYYACKMRDQGLPLEELYQWCLDNRESMCHFFTVDDLMFLKRGGRISAATAVVGTMLGIKPVLHVDSEGHLISIAKARGRKASIDALIRKMEELGKGFENETVFICHGDCLADAEYLAKEVKSRFGVKEVLIGYTGAVIGSHSGPGTLALFFRGEHR